MLKRKREASDSDDLVESSEKVKDLLPEDAEVILKKKLKKNKQQSTETTDENVVKDVLSANEESLLLSPKKKTKKNKQQSAEVSDEEVMHVKNVSSANEEDVSSANEETISLSPKKKKLKSKQQSADFSDEEVTHMKDVSSANEESFSLSPKKKKKKNKQKSAAEEEPNRESDKDQETSKASTPCKPTAQKKASLSKGFVLFVGQIPHHIKQKDVEKHFATVGGVKDVRLLIYPDSQRSRGCAYVEFIDNQHRKKALELNGSTLGRAKIKVEYPYQGGKRYGGSKKNKAKGKN